MQRFFLGLVLSVSVTACSGSKDDAPATHDELRGEADRQPRIAPGAFKLYGAPGGGPEDRCDQHEALEITADNEAKLERRAAAACDPNPSPRTYKLTLARVEYCGSQVWTGERRDASNRKFTISLTDNRGRTCPPLPEAYARIVVDEAGEERGDDTQTWYSDDR